MRRSWFRWQTRTFAVVVAVGALVAATWASTTASDAEWYIPSLAMSGGTLFIWRFGFSPSVRLTATHIVVEQPWWTWWLPLDAVGVVDEQEGCLHIVAGDRDVFAFGLSSSLLLSWFGDRVLTAAIRDLDVALGLRVPSGVTNAPPRVRVSGRRFLTELLVMPATFLAASCVVRFA